ncbi:MAG: hypothetical protein IJ259_04750, partial [Oscillospiraceae bacterium]|nr:hypothetical protein [Oscillospiraceae bacterium]
IEWEKSAETTDPTFTVGSVEEAKPGDTVTVPVGITNNPGFAGLEATITYDSDALELTDLTRVAGPDGFTPNVSKNFLMLDAMDNYTEDGTLFNAVFTVKDSAAAGTYEVGLAVDLLCDDKLTDIENFTVTPGTVTVAAVAHTHTYGEPSYEWAEDNSTCTATAVCTDEACDQSEGATVTETVSATAAVTKEATCAQAGETTYTAAFTNELFAQQTKTEEIAQLDHTPGDPVRENEVDATCEEAGGYDEVVTCTVCGEEISREHVTLDALDHDWDDGVVTTAATCTEDGVKTFTCKRDASHTKTEAIPAAGHEYRESYTWADDNSTVTGTATCNVCGDEITETVSASYEETAAATDTEAGAGVYTSAAFENALFEAQTKDVTIAPAGHTYGAPVWSWADDYSSATATFSCTTCDDVQEVTATVSPVTKPATCTEDGETVYTASVTFNDVNYDDTRTVALPATGHTAGDPVKENEVEATCTEGGSYDQVVYCADCGAELSREHITVEALGHEYKDEVTAPTCTEKGCTTHTCTRCGDSYQDAEVDALGHEYKDEVTAPTCTEKGYTTHTCTRCDDSYQDTEVDALGHDWGQWAVTTEPTCDQQGEETRTCARCGEEETRPVETIPHTLEKTEAKEATCTEAGNTEYYTCSVCGKYFSDADGKNEIQQADTVVDALGHQWDDGVVTKEATTEAEGEKTYTCTVCGEKKTEVIPKLEPEKPDEPATEDVEYVFTTAETGFQVKQGEELVVTIKRTENDEQTYERFTGVQIDGQTVDPANYTTQKGSVIITVNADYVKTLTPGQHTIRALFNDGDAEHGLTVAADPGTPGTPENKGSGDNASGTKDNTKTPDTPKTGDESNLSLYVLIMAFSLTALIALVAVEVNKKKQK